MHQLVLAVGFGFVTASVLALGAVGATVQIGITNFVNFAYGDFMTIGGYLALIALVHLHLPLLLALAFAAVGTGLVALLLDLVVFEPFVRDRVRVITMTVVTLALSLIIAGFLQAVFGSTFQTYNLPRQQGMPIGPFLWTPDQLVIMGAAVAVLGTLQVLLQRTRVGKALRAMADNSELAQASAIDVQLLTRLTWCISGALAGIAGVVLVLQTGVLTPSTGLTYLFVVMAPVIMGGIGKPLGTIASCVILGLIMEIASVYINGAYIYAVAFGALVIVLLVRPNGLVTARGRH